MNPLKRFLILLVLGVIVGFVVGFCQARAADGTEARSCHKVCEIGLARGREAVGRRFESSPYRPPCYGSPTEVRRHFPGAWPHWTTHMKGHYGQMCWYTGKQKEVMQADRGGNASSDSSSNVTFPRKEVMQPDRERSSRNESSSSSNNVTYSRKEVVPLTNIPMQFIDAFSHFITPLQRIEDSFNTMGYR